MKTAIITGATKGIGLALTKQFAKAGFNLGLCARNVSDLNQLKTTIETEFKVAVHVKVCDVSVKKQVVGFAGFCLEKLGQVNVLVNNAGVFLPGSLTDGSDENFETVMHTNLFSVFYLTKAILPTMIKQQQGHVFNINSIAGLLAYANGGSYNVSKHALTGYTKTLRNEVREHGIKVTDVHPGAVLTNSWAGVDLPETRFMKPEDIAQTVFDAYSLSERTMIEEIVLRPQLGDI